ncbi:MAG: hypothetical protein KDD53_02000 [Bdellovibrionales bacterium]|nr:hypothetical protein [Bdellovibrionales bacterium]
MSDLFCSKNSRVDGTEDQGLGDLTGPVRTSIEVPRAISWFKRIAASGLLLGAFAGCSDSNETSPTQDIDPKESTERLETKASLYEVISEQLIERLGSLNSTARHYQFAKANNVSIVFSDEMLDVAVASYTSNDGVVRIREKYVQSNIADLIAVGYTQDQAVEIVVIRLLPTLAHELRHGMIDEDFKKVFELEFGGKIFEEEVVVSVEESIVQREVLDKWGDNLPLDRLDPRSPSASADFLWAFQKELLKLGGVTAIQAEAQIRYNRKDADGEWLTVSISRPQLDRERDMPAGIARLQRLRVAQESFLDNPDEPFEGTSREEMAEALLTSNRIIREWNALFDLMEDPAQANKMRSYFRELLESFQVESRYSAPGSYSTSISPYLRAYVVSNLQQALNLVHGQASGAELESAILTIAKLVSGAPLTQEEDYMIESIPNHFADILPSLYAYSDREAVSLVAAIGLAEAITGKDFLSLTRGKLDTLVLLAK